MDKISIVMATYNGGRFLKEQLNSLCKQTRIPDEVIVVDDGSTDNTLAILEEFSKVLNLSIHINTNHLGVNGNFEKGLNLCSGDYIMFCDQDDYWLPNKIELMYKKMLEIEDKKTPCIVSSRDTYADINLKESPQLNPYPSYIFYPKNNCDYRETVIKHLSQGCAMMLNRKCLEYILPIPNNEVCYDYYIGFIVAMIGKKYDMKESLMLYRVHGNNVTASINNNYTQIPKRRHRNPGVVPQHFIDTYNIAISQKQNYFIKERYNYVKRIISLANNNNSIWRHITILFSTPNIPIKLKYTSLKNKLLNFIFQV